MAKRKMNAFEDLRQSLRDAIAYEKGMDVGLRVSELVSRPRPLSSKEVVRIRKAMGLSQTVFAKVINVSPNAVRSWEQGTRKPAAATLKLLTVAKEHPEVLLKKRA